jgi:hypothetical protein
MVFSTIVTRSGVFTLENSSYALMANEEVEDG